MCQNKLHAITHEKVIAKQNYQRHVYQFVEEKVILNTTHLVTDTILQKTVVTVSTVLLNKLPIQSVLCLPKR